MYTTSVSLKGAGFVANDLSVCEQVKLVQEDNGLIEILSPKAFPTYRILAFEVW